MTGSDGGGLRAFLYDKDGSDRQVDLDESTVADLSEEHLLWVDVSTDESQLTGAGEDALRRLAGERASAWLGRDDGAAVAETAEDRLMVGVVGATDHEERIGIRCLVGPRWIVTAHSSSVDLIEAFNQSVSKGSNLGKMDGPRFLAVLLDGHLRSFFDRVEELDRKVDDLDEELISAPAAADRALLDRIVQLRHRTGQLRRIVVAHRDVLARLSDPELAVLSGSDSAHRFADLDRRLETVIGSIDSTRASITGSLDVFMTRTAQRTNEVMKVLTLASVLMLPSTVIAGVMGMNFEVGLFGNPAGFWIVIIVMITVAATTLAVARHRRWIGVKSL